MTIPTRRDTLAGLAAASLGAGVGAPAWARRQPVGGARDETADVLVLGGGVSGLHAARLLAEQGRKPLVLEAAGAVGGKVRTHRVGGSFVELGGQNILPGYSRVLEACQTYGIGLIDANQRAPRKAGLPSLILQGELIPAGAWARHARNTQPEAARTLLPSTFAASALARTAPFREAADWLDPAQAVNDIPVHQALLRAGLTPGQIRLGYDVNVGYGSSSHDVSALMMWFVGLWGAQQGSFGLQNWGVAAGNEGLPRAMAAALGDAVRLNREVVAVEQTGSGVAARCRDGSVYRARGLVCALPLSVMRTIAFEPGLPPAQAEAVQTVKAMQIANAVLIPRRRFWEEDGLGLSMLSDGPAGMVLAQAYDPDPNQINAFLVFARGPWAQFLDRRGSEAAKALILADIERARPAARGALDVVHYWSWSAYPYTAGAFSVFGPGQVSRLARAMAAPVGRITFAGEQNAALNRGLEGAFEAGERAALELLDLI